MVQEKKILLKCQIIAAFQNLNSQKMIAKKYKLHPSFVSRTINDYNKRGSVLRKPGSGRRLSLNKGDLLFLEREITMNPIIGSTKLKEVLNEHRGLTVTDRTVRNALTKMGFNGRRRAKKPLLSRKNIDDRMRLSKIWYYNSEEYLKSIVWSDETKINLFESDGIAYCRRKVNTRFYLKNLKPTIKHGGGSIMIWGCFSYEGVGKIQIIEGKMNSLMYTTILNENLFESVKNLKKQDFIFQQDNDPKHTSMLTRDFFKLKNIKILEWPSQSPDLNPIENLWFVLKKKVSKRRCKNIEELKVAVVEEWNSISVETCKKLIKGIKKRFEEVIKANGGHTSY